ncbi:MAG: hypothetical protein JW395_0871 [Nitrospira sp.]|nr:hypothetical protein [Nitrospira sp.]
MPEEGMASQRPPDQVAAGRARLTQAAEEAGIPIGFRERMSNSRLALEAAEMAREQGKLHEFHTRVLKAYWVERQDIGEAATVVALGTEAGLDGEALRQALAERRYRPAVDALVQEANELGIHAVPSFVFQEKYLVQGAQPYEVFKQVMERYVLPEQRGEGAGEDATAG